MMLRGYIIHYNGRLTSVPVKPLIHLFGKILRVHCTSKRRLPRTSRTIYPNTSHLSRCRLKRGTILMDLPQVRILSDVNIGRNRLKPSLTSMLLYLSPVRLIVPLKGLFTKRPRTTNSSLLLGTIPRCSKHTLLHLFPMKLGILSLQRLKSTCILKIHTKLKMGSTILSLL